MTDVSIVMPCLNEGRTLGHCIAVARRALERLQERHALVGEIVVADNGSTDGSQELALTLGARVVTVARRGYGAAVCGGFAAARGRYLVMGDADGSYDFLEAVPMVEALMNGADLCMGSRFKGVIEAGAMPWKNRYIGNPVLTGILNLLFRSGIDDAHCGMRALTKRCFLRLRLEGPGMELASEMVIKAALLGQRIAEVPVTLSPDRRDRPPHLRPWRDGWRHLRYLLMLSPAWLFAIPAGALGAASLAILATMVITWLSHAEVTRFGNYWAILAGSALTLSHIGIVLALAGQLYGIRERYRTAPKFLQLLAPLLTLEGMLITGLGVIACGLAVLVGVVVYWSAHSLEAIPNVLPAVVGTCAVAIGTQNVLGGFLLAIVSGNDAEFLRVGRADASAARQPVFEEYPAFDQRAPRVGSGHVTAAEPGAIAVDGSA
ncbi:MAG TPA: glycosyltransferase family 2 protein [Xanthobacteraceae bacterium]|nr:glycosyltransferase family 2 protein [Xanthobacteraceae bacterium]